MLLVRNESASMDIIPLGQTVVRMQHNYCSDTAHHDHDLRGTTRPVLLCYLPLKTATN